MRLAYVWLDIRDAPCASGEAPVGARNFHMEGEERLQLTFVDSGRWMRALYSFPAVPVGSRKAL